MTKQVQRRRGTATQHTSFTGAEGELSVNTTNKSVHVHDNVTAGGFEAARADMDNVTSSSILTAAGITATTAELNYVDGVTSAIQTQLDGKAGTASPTFTGTLTTANLTATGTTTLAGASTSADITFGDSDKAIFGAGSDLQIFSEGSGGNSFINETGNGSLYINASNLYLRKGEATFENFIACTANGDVKLYYDNAPKLATTSTGVDITGVLSSDGLTVDGNVGIGTSPSTTLDVNKSQTLTSLTSPANAALRLQNTNGSANNYFTALSFTTSTTGVGTDSAIVSYSESAGNSALAFYTDSSNVIGERMRITSAGTLQIAGGGNDNVGEINMGNTAQNANRFQVRHQSSAWYLKTVDSEPLVFGTANTEAMSLDASGRLGLKTSANVSFDQVAGANLFVLGSGAGDQGMTIYSGNSGTGNIMFADGTTTTTQYEGYVQYVHSDNRLLFGTNHAPRMTIDGSGNLLVGTTVLTDINSSGTGNEGAFIQNYGHLGIAVSNDKTATFNRKTSDGDILEFRKDGSTVGSIGAISGDMYIGNGDTGMRFFDAGDAIIPTTTNGASSDAARDLGYSSIRWRNLYLSGGVYLGGTGSANKLDDYESGEFDVTASPATSGTVTLQSANNRASYTKVGRLVHCSGFFIVDSVSSPVGTELHMTLPFAAGQGGDQSLRVGMPIVHYDGSSDTVKPAIVVETQSIVKIILDCSTITTGDAFYYGFTYQSA